MVNIRSTENPKLVEELARIRHEQVRSWTRHMFIQLNKVQMNKGTLDDFGKQLNALCKDMWHEFDQAPNHVREANINWAENILKVIRRYELGA